MVVIDREIGGFTLAFGKPEDLTRGEIDDTRDPSPLSSQEHMPGAEHVGRNDVRWGASTVVSDRPSVDDLIRLFDSFEHGRIVPKIKALSQIERRNGPASRFENQSGCLTDFSRRACQQHSSHAHIVSTTRAGTCDPDRRPASAAAGTYLRKYWFVNGNRSVDDDGIELELIAIPAEEDVQVLRNGLERFNRASPLGRDPVKIPIAVWMRREGQVLGGAYGDTHYGWLYLSLLWVVEELRGLGWGRSLLEHCEAEAAARGCHGAWVDTYEFQAPTFYEQLGYREFGRLDEFPPSSARLFFWKPLRPGGEAGFKGSVQ